MYEVVPEESTPISAVLQALIEAHGVDPALKQYVLKWPEDVPGLDRPNVFEHRYWTFDVGQPISAMPEPKEIVALTIEGSVIWEETGCQVWPTTSFGDLFRSFECGYLENSPTKIVAVFDLAIGGVQASYMMDMPPDLWKDLAALAALLFAVSETLDKAASLREKLTRATVTLWALASFRTRRLATDVPPQRVVRFLRSKDQWTLGEVRRRLLVDEFEARALLTFAGYGEDEKDGLWYRGLDVDAQLAARVTDELLQILRTRDGQFVNPPRFGECIILWSEIIPEDAPEPQSPDTEEVKSVTDIIASIELTAERRQRLYHLLADLDSRLRENRRLPPGDGWNR